MTSTPPPDDTGERPLETLRADVADAVGALAGLQDRPVAEHVAVYERLHTALGDALSAGPDRA
jgi:hypothetical protein